MFSEYEINRRHHVTIHCLITLKSPLSHIGTVTGNVSNLNSLEILDLEGNRRSCFVYSGNALRNGVLRRRGVADALTALGLQVNPDVHHTLFAGGRIDRGGDMGCDLDLDKRIRQLMPWLSVLGTAKPAKVFGAKNAQMVQGRLNVGNAFLICYESAHYVWQQMPGLLPAECAAKIAEIDASMRGLSDDPFVSPTERAIAAHKTLVAQHIPYLRKQLRHWNEYVVVQQTTRRDSTHDPNLQQFLPTEAPKLLAGDAGKPKKSDQMIASDRLVMSGSRLYSRWDFHGTDVEEGFLYAALLAFAQSPYLGGKGQRGNGLVDLELWYQTPEGDRGRLMQLGSTAQILGDRATTQHNRYQEYLQTYRGFLEEAAQSQELSQLLGGT